MTAAFILLVNFILVITIQYFTEKEKFLYRTTHDVFIQVKMTIAMIINTAGINSFLYRNKWYGTDSLIEISYDVIILNAIFSPLSYLL